MSSSGDVPAQQAPGRQAADAASFEVRRLVTIGRLAGALAHDFNNHLTAILGYVGLLLEDLADHPSHDDLVEIQRSGERAAELTRLLLAFNRGRSADPQLLSWPALVQELRPLVNGILGDRIALAVEVGEPPDVTARKADAGHLLFAVALAAADVLAAGSTVTVRIDRRNLDDGRDGCVVLARLFDPGGTPHVPDAVRADLQSLCAAQDAAFDASAGAGLVELRFHYPAADQVEAG